MWAKLLATALLLLLASTLAALDRMEPVRPEKPVPSDVKAVFDDFFGPKVAKVATDPTATGELASQIFEEAKKRSDNPDFAAYALDQVVYLASVVPGRQSLVYTALRTQKESNLRPSQGCLEKMILVGPRVAEELHGEARADWITNTWTKDALQLVDLRVRATDYKQAAETLTAVADVLKKFKLPVTTEIEQNLKGLDFLQTLKTTLQDYEDQIKEPGDHQQAFMAVAIVNLVRARNLQKGIENLKASTDPTAADLALALATGPNGIPKSSGAVQAELTIIKAEAALAEKVQGVYFRLLLWKDAEARLAAVRGLGFLTKTQQLGVDLQTDAVVPKSKEALDKLPPMVQKQFEEAQFAIRDVAASPAPKPRAAKNNNSDASGTMPAADLEKLQQAVISLRNHLTCVNCRGTGVVSGVLCGCCSGTEPWGDKVKGNGKTKLEDLRPYMANVQDLLDRYGDAVPIKLRNIAKALLQQIEDDYAEFHKRK